MAVTPSSAGNRWLPVLVGVVVNVVTLLGVVSWGWPPGNVFLLFLAENLVIGAVTVIRTLTAPGGTVGMALFFCLHYGFFCALHAVFTVLLLRTVPFTVTFMMFGLPLLLIAGRHVGELISQWFIAGGRSHAPSANKIMIAPYQRVFVLQAATIIGLNVQDGEQNWLTGALDWLSTQLAGWGLQLDHGATLVLALLLVKTYTDIHWTISEQRREAKSR